jgi:hypothetical protein
MEEIKPVITEAKEPPEKREDQDRTRFKKEMFIEYYKRHFGVITKVCEEVKIERTAFYRWKRDDPEFLKKLKEAEGERNDSVEDVLFSLIAKQDGPSVRFYLERRNPAYKQKTVNEVIPGELTLEDLIDEFKNKDDELSKQQSIDSESSADTQQEGNTSAVQIQHSTGILLGTENAPQSNIESPTKGAK